MRAIKFRIWDKENKKMIYPKYTSAISDKQAERQCIKLFPDSSCGVFNEDKEDFIVIIQPYEDFLMQFTGLKDKNGKEIYEGDILSTVERDVNFVVGFGENGDDKSFGFNLKSFRLNQVYGFDTSVKDMEVIGNIHENPELLKE